MHNVPTTLGSVEYYMHNILLFWLDRLFQLLEPVVWLVTPILPYPQLPWITIKTYLPIDRNFS